MRRWIPLAIFATLGGFLYLGLYLHPREVPSPFIGKPAPAFTLPVVGEPGRSFSPVQATGKVWLLNIWAPWCSTCRAEHDFLMRLAEAGIPIYGLNWKDRDREAASWLAREGSPYVLSVDDYDGRVGIDYGVTGTPETFIIDRTGTIRYKHSGPIDEEVWKNKLMPLMKKLAT